MRYIFHVRVNDSYEPEQKKQLLEEFMDNVNSQNFFESHEKVLYVTDNDRSWVEVVPSEFE